MTAAAHRYFMGLIGFAFVVSWATTGFLVATVGLAVCVAIVFGPGLAGRRRPTPRRSPVRTRPITTEIPDTYQLVPDDPSLVVELG